ncbi:hypothetical protein [Streptomyces sp. NPDC005408]|uniref:DUF6907 domain-containing protein n=1 Tax=Streptomyces sp. NPDC005408 TaxID=3155341 RepID=UPI0033A267D2
MYETVSGIVKPSGAYVAPSSDLLNGIPVQPVPFELTAAALKALDEPRTWSFISTVSGDLVAVTCMQGCQMDHSHDIETPTHPDDIWCQTVSRTVTLPVNDSGTPEEVPVLSWTLNARPFDRKLSERLPHACVEVMQDAWIEDLDPDAFEGVIDTLEERVRAMRAAHAELLRVRAAYKAGR